ncbi:FecR domain-containing protein [Phenylobacterium sp.]|uniref:FecR family protein n=1 Tax=Phenylobacterium sp. TaxID=1871053 RepID=UPI0027302865|nr:FecR domain-containing protein [Phenylobacterium sp.]MDP2213601.1 FecR domain-containing protein [Phenylobacterium sp.]
MNDDQRAEGPSGDPDAASWFVRLQRQPDDSELRSAFDAWRTADPSHARAWAEVARTWDQLGDLKDDPEILAARAAMKAELAAERRGSRMPWAAGIAAAVVTGGALLGYGLWGPGRGPDAPTAAATPQAVAIYRTMVGEQQTVVLEDGSKVTLNTDTEVQLTGWDGGRDLTLVQGEAYFVVAKNTERPFVVTAGGRRVTALGTAFAVRIEPTRWSVALMEGKVRIEGPQAAAVEMEPGQYLVQDGDHPWTIERRNLEDLTSWRDGSLTFENRPLGQVVEEMNRYSRRKVRVADPVLASRPLSGRFKSGDMAGFVATLEAYGLVRAERGATDTIDLHPVVSE